MPSSAVVPRVLLVDDNDVMRETWSLLLTPMGFELTTASDGLEAISSAKLLIPDVIVTDFMMPGMTGIELFWALQREDILKAVPVIFLTSAMFPPDRPIADRWFAKHISPERLATTIRSVVLGY